MPKEGIVYQTVPFSIPQKIYRDVACKISYAANLLLNRRNIHLCHANARILYKLKNASLDFVTRRYESRSWEVKSLANESVEELSEEDDELCPVDCVKEFSTDEEFFKILEKARKTNSLVVVDFYRTSCGSCKYIEQGFAKLCKGSGDEEAPVIFLKHNVLDEYDEESEVAERLRIRSVPLFHFYKNGVLLEAFPTRDKGRILAAILKYTSTTPQDA